MGIFTIFVDSLGRIVRIEQVGSGFGNIIAGIFGIIFGPVLLAGISLLVMNFAYQLLSLLITSFLILTVLVGLTIAKGSKNGKFFFNGLYSIIVTPLLLMGLTGYLIEEGVLGDYLLELAANAGFYNKETTTLIIILWVSSLLIYCIGNFLFAFIEKSAEAVYKAKTNPNPKKSNRRPLP